MSEPAPPATAKRRPAPGAGEATALASVWLLTAWAVGAGASVVYNIVATRLFDKAHYGVFGLVLTTLVWVEYAVSSTFPASYGKLASESAGNLSRIRRSVLWLCLPSCLGLWVVFTLLSGPIARLLDAPEAAPLLRWAAIDIPLLGMYTVALGVLNGLGRSGQMGFVAACYQVSRAVFITGLLVLLRLGLGTSEATAVAGGLMGKAVASAIGLAIGLWFLRRVPRVAPTGRSTLYARHIGRFGVPLGLTTIAMYFLIDVDLWMVSRLLTDADKAHYVAARSVAYLSVFVAIAMRNAVFPEMARNLHHGRAAEAAVALRTGVRTVLMIGGLLCALLIPTATDLSAWFFKYPEAGTPMGVLVLALALYGVFMVYVSAYAAANRPLAPFVLLLALTPLTVAGHELAIPRFGVVAAAVVTLAVMVVGVAALAGWLWWRLRIRPAFFDALRIGGAAAAVALASLLLPVRGAALLPKYAVMGLAYAALLVAVREVRVAEVRQLLQAVRRKLGKAEWIEPADES